jgi:glutathione S-transferase
MAYLDRARALVRPAGEGFFAGQGPTGANSNAIARWAFRAFGGDVEGDGRDWDAIKAWAERVPV